MKRKNVIKTLLVGTIAAGLLAGGGAMARNHGNAQGGGFGGGPERPGFAQLDANGDSELTVAEIQAHEQARFDAVDSNGDGVISGEESAAAAAEKAAMRATQRFEKMLQWRDADGDGALSPSEMSDNRAQMMFSRADTNGDGVVSKAEFEAAKDQGGRMGRGQKGPRGQGGEGQHGGRQGG